MRVINKIIFEISELFLKIKNFIYPVHINGSIIEYQGQFYISARKNDRYITIAKLKMMPDDVPHIAVEEKTIKLSLHRPRKDWVTDPRLFVHGDKLFCAYTYEIYPPRGSRQAIAEIKPNGEVVSDTVFNYSVNSHEKNWSFFENDNKLLFVYTVGPDHIVIDTDMNIKGKTPGIKWAYGQARGGTPSIRVGDQYFSVFHSFVEVDNLLPIGILKRKYVAGWYSFDAKAPFKITKFSENPIMIPESCGQFDHDVIFPCGLIKNNDIFLMSYGYNSREVRIVQLDKSFKPLSIGKKIVWRRSFIPNFLYDLKNFFNF